MENRPFDTWASRPKHSMRRLVFILFAVFIALAFTLSQAVATTWDGHGADSVVECDEGEEPYLHWVYTGGEGENSITLTLYDETITVLETQEMEQKGGSDQGAWHAFTGFYDLDTLAAETSDDPDDHPDRDILTISDGCFGPAPEETPTDDETTPSDEETTPADDETTPAEETETEEEAEVEVLPTEVEAEPEPEPSPEVLGVTEERPTEEAQPAPEQEPAAEEAVAVEGELPRTGWGLLVHALIGLSLMGAGGYTLRRTRE